VEFCRRHQNKVVPRLTHPGGTGYARGLYSIQGAPPNLKDLFEDKFLNASDGIAAKALDTMLNDNLVPTGTDKIGWTRFMLSLFHRTPEAIARTVAMINAQYDGPYMKKLRDIYDLHKRTWHRP